jgi:hypothetical protein
VADEIVSFRVALAVLREAGVDFATAWDVAVPAPLADRNRVALREALTSTKAAWARACEPPTRGELAAAMIPALAREDETTDTAPVELPHAAPIACEPHLALPRRAAPELTKPHPTRPCPESSRFVVAAHASPSSSTAAPMRPSIRARRRSIAPIDERSSRTSA